VDSTTFKLTPVSSWNVASSNYWPRAHETRPNGQPVRATRRERENLKRRQRVIQLVLLQELLDQPDHAGAVSGRPGYRGTRQDQQQREAMASSTTYSTASISSVMVATDGQLGPTAAEVLERETCQPALTTYEDLISCRLPPRVGQLRHNGSAPNCRSCCRQSWAGLPFCPRTPPSTSPSAPD